MARLSTRNRVASSSNEEEPHGQRRCVGGCCAVSRSLSGHLPGDLYVKAVSRKEGALSGRGREDVCCVGEVLLAADDALDLSLREGGRFLILGRTDIGGHPDQNRERSRCGSGCPSFFDARIPPGPTRRSVAVIERVSGDSSLAPTGMDECIEKPKRWVGQRGGEHSVFFLSFLGEAPVCLLGSTYRFQAL